MFSLNYSGGHRMTKNLRVSAWVIVCFLANSAFAAEGKSVGTQLTGFVDAQYQWTNTLRPGFVINDGAVYLTHGLTNGLGAKIDLPFRWVGETDSDGDGVKEYSNNFVFAETKAQAYISNRYESGWNWKFGQFDTIYGLELNDSPEITFSKQGLVYAAALPLTHTGAMVGYSNSSFGMNLLVSNPLNQGSMTNSNPEFGAQFLFNPNSQFRMSAGYLGHKMEDGMRNFGDLILGMTSGSLSADLEAVLLKTPGAPKTGLGVMLLPVYSFNDSWSGALRVEYLKEVNAIHQQQQYSVGPQYKANASLKAKLDYSLQKTTEVEGADSVTSHAVNFALVYSFL